MLEKFQKDLLENGEVFLRIKVIPRMPKNEIVEIMDDGTIKIRVKAVAENGKANLELCKYLKKELRGSEAKLISGQTSRIKLIKISK